MTEDALTVAQLLEEAQANAKREAVGDSGVEGMGVDDT